MVSEHLLTGDIKLCVEHKLSSRACTTAINKVNSRIQGRSEEKSTLTSNSERDCSNAQHCLHMKHGWNARLARYANA